MSDLIPTERIERKILFIRNQRILLDRDLADLYGVPTGQLKRTVKRNIQRFPEDFMFIFTKEELENWRCQFGTSNDTMGLRYPPMAFSELGVAMLSSVLNSEKAIQINIAIMKTFVRMRRMIRNDELTQARLDDIEDRLGAHEFQTLAVLDQLGAMNLTGYRRDSIKSFNTEETEVRKRRKTNSYTIKKKLAARKSDKPLIGFPIPREND